MTADPPRRRRGEALRAAIFEAVAAELVDHGYGGLTVEGVAARAQTGKASIYRYWPTKEELVLDAIRWFMPPIEDPPFTDSVREDFLLMLRMIAAATVSPAGIALDGLLAEAARHPGVARAVFEHVIEPRQRIMLESLRRAAARGEISPAAVTLLPVQVAVGVMNLHRLQYGGPPADRELVEIVDRAILPIIGYRAAG